MERPRRGRRSRAARTVAGFGRGDAGDEQPRENRARSNRSRGSAAGSRASRPGTRTRRQDEQGTTTVASKRKILANRQNWRLRGPLTNAGRELLRLAAIRNEPWASSTGPRSAAGKRRSSMNALRTGRHTKAARAWRKAAMRFLRANCLLRDVIVGRTEVADPMALVAELRQLARWLSKHNLVHASTRQPADASESAAQRQP